MRHLPGVLDQTPEKNCWVESVNRLARRCWGLPPNTRSAAGAEVSQDCGEAKSTILAFMARIMRAPRHDPGLESGSCRRASSRGSVAGERCRGLEADLDAALEGL